MNYYASSSPMASSAVFRACFRLTRPGRPPPYGDFVEKSICFCESSRTMNDGTFTTCLRTLQLFIIFLKNSYKHTVVTKKLVSENGNSESLKYTQIFFEVLDHHHFCTEQYYKILQFFQKTISILSKFEIQTQKIIFKSF